MFIGQIKRLLWFRSNWNVLLKRFSLLKGYPFDETSCTKMAEIRFGILLLATVSLRHVVFCMKALLPKYVLSLLFHLQGNEKIFSVILLLHTLYHSFF